MDELAVTRRDRKDPQIKPRRYFLIFHCFPSDFCILYLIRIKNSI
jgi:hypothetical protein